MEAKIRTAQGAMVTLQDVRFGRRAVTANVEGERIVVPNNRLLAQRLRVEHERRRRAAVR